jgi:hypothetical protein
VSEQSNENFNIVTYLDPFEFLEKTNQIFTESEVVLDIGCGIYPMNFYVPKLHIMVEPWKEYVEILKQRYHNDSRVLIFQSNALEFLNTLSDKSVDTVFLLDVIEHLEKEDGVSLIEEIERVASQQIVIFTPLGFMPQHVDSRKLDRWGLSGGDFQEHKSGWLPNDFSDDWMFYVCPEFHKFDDDGIKLPQPFGAFYAVKNLTQLEIQSGKPYFGNFFKPTAKDLELNNLTQELNNLTQELNNLTQERNNLAQERNNLAQELNNVTQSHSWRLTGVLRKTSYFLKCFMRAIK